MVTYRPGPLMASADWLYITVKGRQTHGAWPWKGVDPVVTAAQIITGLQNIVARQLERFGAVIGFAGAPFTLQRACPL